MSRSNGTSEPKGVDVRQISVRQTSEYAVEIERVAVTRTKDNVLVGGFPIGRSARRDDRAAHAHGYWPDAPAPVGHTSPWSIPAPGVAEGETGLPAAPPGGQDA